jgi:hypothetical protein
MNHEGLAQAYRSNAGFWTARLASYCKNKPFKKMIREDTISFLSTFEKKEADPLHHWVGSYNSILIHLMRFFRWLYHPNQPARPKPKVGTKYFNEA